MLCPHVVMNGNEWLYITIIFITCFLHVASHVFSLDPSFALHATTCYYKMEPFLPPTEEFPFGIVTSLVMLLLVVALIYKNKSNVTRKNKVPPGPSWALPLLGHLLQLGSRPSVSFQKWRKAYGPVFSLQLGSNKAVVVSDHKLVKQLFSNPATTGRIHTAVSEVFGEGKGLLSRDDEGWAPQRRFTLRTLKDLGLNRGGVLEGIIADEAGRLVKFFEKRANLPIPGNRTFNGAVLNSLWTLVTGERHEWDVPEEPEHLAKSGRLISVANNLAETGLQFFTWLRFVAPSWSGWNEWVEANKDLMALSRRIIERHVEARRQHVCSNDYVDLYLNEMEATTEPASSFYGEAGMQSLTANVADFIMAGTETTSTTLEYMMLYLSKYSHVQAEIHSELDGVVGRSRAPNLADRRNMLYTEAVILEVHRLASITPMGNPHSTLEDIEFASYIIPKGTILIPDFWNIHRDPGVWGGDAADFRPERFLNEDRTKVVSHEGLLPFSTGRRACIGEGLATDSLFIFLTCLMQKFRVELVGDGIELDEPLPGFLSKPKPFKMVMTMRK